MDKPASPRRGTLDNKDRATSYKSGQLAALGFRLLSVDERRTLAAVLVAVLGFYDEDATCV